MITEQRLFILMCIKNGSDISDIDSLDWLIANGYATEPGECTEKGTMTVQYAVKKAGEI